MMALSMMEPLSMDSEMDKAYWRLKQVSDTVENGRTIDDMALGSKDMLMRANMSEDL